MSIDEQSGSAQPAGRSAREIVARSSRRVPTSRDAHPRINRSRAAYLYVLPGFGIYVLFIVLPTLHTAYLSFFQWDGLTTARWVGVRNYTSLATQPELYQAIIHSAELLVFFTLLPILLALLITGLIGVRAVRGLSVLRTVFFLPQVVPLLAIGIIWRWMYNVDGPVAALGRFVGLGGPREGWLGNFTTALPAIGVVGTWALYGVCLTLFMTGVQKLDTNLIDAVKMDGGGRVWEFRAVILPGLRREISLAAALTGIAALASFDLVYIATRGGPGDTTVVPGLLIYQLGFTTGAIGPAAALAVALTVITGIYVLAVSRIDPSRRARG